MTQQGDLRVVVAMGDGRYGLLWSATLRGRLAAKVGLGMDKC